MPVLIVVAALAAVAVVCVAVYLHRLRRALIAERAARRLAAGMQARDFQALSDRLNKAVYANQVLREAEQVLDIALATYDTEGGRS